MDEMTEEMKTCPFCAEKIKAAAIVCRYCRRELARPVRPADLDRPDPVRPAVISPQTAFAIGIAVFLILMLPLLMVARAVPGRTVESIPATKTAEIQTTIPEPSIVEQSATAQAVELHH